MARDISLSYGAAPQPQNNIGVHCGVLNITLTCDNSLFKSPSSDHAKFGDFALIFCSGQLRIVQLFKTHVRPLCRRRRDFVVPRTAVYDDRVTTIDLRNSVVCTLRLHYQKNTLLLIRFSFRGIVFCGK